VKDNSILNSSKEAIDQGPPAWSIDDAVAMSLDFWKRCKSWLQTQRDGIPARLVRRTATTFAEFHCCGRVSQDCLCDRRHRVAALKDSNEPIQKNLGERMAFIIGESLEERKKIVANVEDFYRIRSRLVITAVRQPSQTSR